MLKSSTYDKLKIVSLIIGYAATFILTLTDIWGFKYGAEIAASVSAFGILLGSVLTASSKSYYSMIEEDGAAEWEIETMEENDADSE